MADPSILDYIRAQAARRKLDPAAVIAVGMQEGLGHTGDHATGGGIGDSGTSFGPWQLHYGGAYPSFAPQGAQASHKWAWSPAGIDYALDQIAKVAAGQQGPAAINSIVRRFERPALPDPEVARAISIYGQPQHSSVPFTDPAVASVTPTPKSTVGHALATNDVAAPLMREVPQPDQRRAFAQSLIGAIDAKGQLSTQGLLGALQQQKKLIWQSPQQTAPVAPPAEAPALTRTPTVAPQAPTRQTSSAAPQTGLVAPVDGKLIGTPHQGTHTLGNWESDNAVDVAVPVGTPIVAPFSGVIGDQFGSLGSGGRFAGLRAHVIGDGNEAYLAHLSKFAPGIAPGKHVHAGDVIGYSGEANGVAHLHFGVRNGNPTSYYGG